jgi:hypothetical protein
MVMDAFISHSSRNRAVAASVEASLEAAGLRVWLDDSELGLGAMLRTELRESIRDSRVLLLLWSRHAAASRWVASEWLSAFHLGRFIVPCVLDGTPLPQCLQGTVFLRMRRITAQATERLARAVREAPDGPNRLPPIMRAESPELAEAIDTIQNGQSAVGEQLARRDIDEAATVQRSVSTAMDRALEAWPVDPMILNLAGYDLKNEYMVKHWDAIQAGRGPRDPLLAASEHRFFETLAIDPTDPAALNGLGSVLIFQRDLEAAEFFIRAALAEAKRRDISYPAAEQDLQLVLRFKPS